MADWTAVTLTQARQVAILMGIEEDRLPPESVGVREHYDALRGEDRWPAAIDYLSHALPRLEGVAWTAHLLDEESRTHDLPSRDRQALDTTLRWLGTPNDTNRRAARDAANAAARNSAERYLGLAVFHSGGSISSPGLPSILPPPQASCRYVAGAIKQAGYRTPTPNAFFERALRVGETVAERGLAALT